MTKFTDDLEKACITAAQILRADVTSEDDTRKYREMRQEANFVAEAYHVLRGMNKRYQAEDFFLEYMYPKKVSLWSKKRRLKPDLIYETNDGDEVVEFTAFWDGNIKRGDSKIIPTGKGVISKYLTKLKAYRKLPNKITSLTLVIAYLGPENVGKGQSFDPKQFKDSILNSISNYGILRKELSSEVHIIIC